MGDQRGTLTGTDLARIRQGSFRLLAAGYGRPSLASNAQIESGLVALDALGFGSFSFAGGFWDWGAALRSAELGGVSAEFVRLFGSGLDGAICSPVESQQLGSNLQGDPARHAGRIEDLMRRSGFSLSDDDRPPDHLVVELELASALCGSEAAARARGESGEQELELQQEIVVVLAMWLPEFARRVIQQDQSGVFGRLAAATDAFVQHEIDLVRLLLDSVPEPA